MYVVYFVRIDVEVWGNYLLEVKDILVFYILIGMIELDVFGFFFLFFVCSEDC